MPEFLPTPETHTIPWGKWHRLFNNHLLAPWSDTHPPAHCKALLLHCLGVEGQHLHYPLLEKKPPAPPEWDRKQAGRQPPAPKQPRYVATWTPGKADRPAGVLRVGMEVEASAKGEERCPEEPLIQGVPRHWCSKVFPAYNPAAAEWRGHPRQRRRIWGSGPSYSHRPQPKALLPLGGLPTSDFSPA